VPATIARVHAHTNSEFSAMIPFTLPSIRSIALGFFVVLLAAGCGGGDDDDTSVSVTTVALTPATLTPPASGTTSLRVGVSAQLNYYPEAGGTAKVAVHLLAAGAAASTASASNQLATTTCQPFNFFAGCSASCTFSSTRVLSCGGVNSVVLSNGSYAMLSRVCIKNKSGGDVCGDKSSVLTVQ
jgi:hypothetical protein